MAYLTAYQYYNDSANYGSYQYVSLKDIVNNFMLNYKGDTSLINNEDRSKVLFHAKRGIQELNYDAFKEVKVLQLDICDNSRFVLPHDYVNYVRISIYKDGLLRPLHENKQVNYATEYLQDNNCEILFDVDGNILKANESGIDIARITGTLKSTYYNHGSLYNGMEGYFYNGQWYFSMGVGGRYGMETSTANSNPTFRIDNKSGVINFSSDMEGESCILEYISDGMEGGDNSKIAVNKLFEKYIYDYIRYEILNNKFGVQEYVVARARKDMSASRRNAKIRISNMHPGRLLMTLRGQDKIIK